jgi:carboxymethylenebutenolidase
MRAHRFAVPVHYLALVILLISAPAAGVEIRESKTSYQSQGKTIAVERFEPQSEGKHPGVLVLHGSGGMWVGGSMFRDCARDLAGRGYVVHIVHYFDQTGTQCVIPNRLLMVKHFRSWALAIAEGITHLSRQPNVDPDRIGLLGFSLGGYLAVAEAMHDPRVSAVVEYYGGVPVVLIPELRRLPPTLILHGDSDEIVSVDEAHLLKRMLEERSLVFESKIYPGQGHAFTGDALRDARERTAAFFDKHVKTADRRKLADVEKTRPVESQAEVD